MSAQPTQAWGRYGVRAHVSLVLGQEVQGVLVRRVDELADLIVDYGGRVLTVRLGEGLIVAAGHSQGTMRCTQHQRQSLGHTRCVCFAYRVSKERLPILSFMPYWMTCTMD